MVHAFTYLILDVLQGREVTNFLAERSGVTGIDNLNFIQYANLNTNINYELVDAQVKTTFINIVPHFSKL